VGSGENYIMRSLMVCTSHSVLFSGDKTKKNGIGGACSAYRGEEVAYRVLMGKPKGLLGRPTPRFKDNIKKDLSGSVNWECGLD
jgi:hypothetical protein